jgi:hypothetical protein
MHRTDGSEKPTLVRNQGNQPLKLYRKRPNFVDVITLGFLGFLVSVTGALAKNSQYRTTATKF